MTNPAFTPPSATSSNQSKANLPRFSFEHFGLKKLVMTILLVVLVAFVWQWVSSPMIVTVQGLGQVAVPATSATISLTVTANAGTSSASIDGVKAKVDGIRTLLIASGINEKDISESQVVSYPAGIVAVGVEGFESVIQMTAKTNNVSGVGELVGSLYNAGAALVNQPVLNVEDQDKLEEKATKEALSDAKSQMSKIANKNFKLIRKMVALTEQSSGTTSTSSVRPELFSQEFGEETPKGTFKIAKLVTVSYKLW